VSAALGGAAAQGGTDPPAPPASLWSGLRIVVISAGGGAWDVCAVRDADRA